MVLLSIGAWCSYTLVMNKSLSIFNFRGHGNQKINKTNPTFFNHMVGNGLCGMYVFAFSLFQR